MEIPSAFNSGLQGLQNASATANKAAADIATNTTLNTDVQKAPGNQGEVSTEISTELSSSAKPSQLPDLNQEIVNLKVAEYQAKSSTEVIKSADDALGTLLDVTA
ncbi:hypothetical protein [Colwellia ponticola]|uniref:Flagellar biosynthesis protein FlgE n=1 Tax=Colwellia ponticola TaxID=2304625 RepID=A0A8H2JLF0_9GAMM|nr:hypothetical protein [Colwellia ponticola]TMM45683.1 hypothetical protein FCS21_07625 [Colwellia ponticola]